MSLTGGLIEYVTGLTYNSLPEQVIEKSKQCILDLFGIMIWAGLNVDCNGPITKAVRELNGGTEGAL